MSEKLVIGKYYPVVDAVPHSDRKTLGITKLTFPLTSIGMPCSGVHAVATGEKRCPRKGEWYLSGSVIEAYRAKNDLTTEFYIARLVKTKIVRTTIIVPVS